MLELVLQDSPSRGETLGDNLKSPESTLGDVDNKDDTGDARSSPADNLEAYSLEEDEPARRSTPDRGM